MLLLGVGGSWNCMFVYDIWKASHDSSYVHIRLRALNPIHFNAVRIYVLLPGRGGQCWKVGVVKEE